MYFAQIQAKLETCIDTWEANPQRVKLLLQVGVK